MKKLLLAAFTLSLSLINPQIEAGTAECDPGEGPDIIVGDVLNRMRYGVVGGVVGFAVGTESCNIGTCQANWLQGTPFHPVIAQNMYRLHQGRFEQIGMSWLKHGFSSVNGSLCGSCMGADSQHLGVNCSDPYGASLNGSQTSLGPRFEVNPETGVHLHPYSFQGQTGNAIYKRMQVKNSDLNPQNYPAAVYFVEGQYVAQDDAAAGNNANNNSYRQVQVLSLGGGEFDFQVIPQWLTVREQPAITVWQAVDPVVDLNWIDGRFVVAGRATDLGAGLWHYEYAIQNVISDRAAGSFTVSLPHGAQVSNIGFRDIDYHSGEPYSSTDWTATLSTGSGPNSITWKTSAFDEDPNANALRWGTLYNFRFDADVTPKRTRASIGLFKPGVPSQYDIGVIGPDRCGDSFCEAPETRVSCAADCRAATLGAAQLDSFLALSIDTEGNVVLDWNPSCLASDDDYAVYRGSLGNFASHAPVTCSTRGATTETVELAAGDHYYLVVPNNGLREGSHGYASDGSPRSTGTAPCMTQLVEACEP